MPSMKNVSRPLKILQVANRAGPLYVFMRPLCAALQQAGADVELACMPGGASWDRLAQTELKLHALPAGSWSRPTTWYRIYHSLRSLMRSVKYDLMIVHTPAMSWVARAAADGLVSKTLYFSHGLPFAPQQPAMIRLSYRCVERFMAKYTDGLIVINSDDAEICRQVRLTRRSGRWYYVPGVGVDSAAFGSDVAESDSETAGEALPVRGDRLMVLYMGRFIRSKRPGDVLELARRIGDKADFVLAGEGPLWTKIKAQAECIGSHVKVLEFTHEPGRLLRQCALAVMPSVYREGLPRFLLEAFAAGKTVVAYDVRGTRDIVDDQVNGRLLPPGDVDGLCDAVASLIEDPVRCRAMGLRGREKVQRKFSLEQSVTAALHAIDDTLGVSRI